MFFSFSSCSNLFTSASFLSFSFELHSTFLTVNTVFSGLLFGFFFKLFLFCGRQFFSFSRLLARLIRLTVFQAFSVFLFFLLSFEFLKVDPRFNITVFIRSEVKVLQDVASVFFELLLLFKIINVSVSVNNLDSHIADFVL